MTAQPNIPTTPVKRDLRAEFKHLYSPSTRTPEIIQVPALPYLMIDGKGDPNVAVAYAQAVEALYSVAYTLKFTLKKTIGMDYPVMPLQGLWWADNLHDFALQERDHWLWTMMIMQPDFITPDQIEAAKQQAARKKDLPALSLLRFDSFEEGAVAQIMHIGAYADETANIQRLHAFIEQNGYALTGKHHEIYLSDPNRTAPDKLKTIIRQPIRRP